jgi:hypothetical protein
MIQLRHSKVEILLSARRKRFEKGTLIVIARATGPGEDETIC